MPFSRGLIGAAALVGSLSLFSTTARPQGAEPALVAGAPVPARLAILLDTSVEMGFLVPQVRKEARILNEQLVAAGRPPVLLREMEGASIDREGSTSVGARKNLIYPLKELFAEADTVYWITALRGEQSPNGMFAIEEMLGEEVEGRPARQLIIRNVWQDQLQAGDTWALRPPPLEEDPLDLRNRPEGWYRIVNEGRGLIVRSWQVPPPDFRTAFLFPYRIAGLPLLKKMDIPDREANFDQQLARDFTERHGLMIMREREQWPSRLTGRRWVSESTLLPFLDEPSREARATAVLASLTARETIEEDLDRIEAARLGVIFAFGYLESDLRHHLSTKDKPPRSARQFYMADLARIAGETLEHLESKKAVKETSHERFYVNDRITLENNRKAPEGPDPYARHIAKLVREKNVDAVYLFTNGYLGEGDYGTFALDLDLLTLAIREAGVRLYVRVPFEFGPAPAALSRLALASGGEVFRGRLDDPDWGMPRPVAAWPEPPPENP
jgi:hypothetical protein